ncbi:Spo0E family sporulation regulatory protein-aspartic acid phosphatase [Bacillus sp. B15-48]|nr:Spo0E family sporulation regulatory protein-aspartic acid phosphatase [Bacillus sp. B15-48]
MTNTASLKGMSANETLKLSQDLDKLIMLSMKYKLQRYL